MKFISLTTRLTTEEVTRSDSIVSLSSESVRDISSVKTLLSDAVDTKQPNIIASMDVSLNNLKVHGDLSANDSSFNNIEAKQVLLRGHVLPSTDSVYDIGSEDFKIRHLFVSTNSIWMGDDHKMQVDGGVIKFKSRKKDVIPKSIKDYSSNVTVEHAQTTMSKNISDFKLKDWISYARTIGMSVSSIRDVYKKSDVEEDFNDDDGIEEDLKWKKFEFN